MSDGKMERIVVRVMPEEKDEIVRLARGKGMNMSDLVREAIYYYLKHNAETEEDREAAKLMYEAMKRKEQVLRAIAATSPLYSLLDRINEIERRKLSPSALRKIYETLVSEFQQDKELLKVLEAEFLHRFGIPPLIVKKPGLRVYSDMLVIDIMQWKPEYVKLILPNSTQERIDIVLENFPIQYYEEIARLCDKLPKRTYILRV